MPEILLAPKERQALKAHAHGLKPVVLLGNSGLSRAVIREIDRALLAHELIKVRVPGDDRDEREGLFAEIAEAVSTGAGARGGRRSDHEQGSASPIAHVGKKCAARPASEPARKAIGPKAHDTRSPRGGACQPRHAGAA